jgi:predicted O-methyltransferase YrrM
VVFAYLESLGTQSYLTVETGCVRQDAWTDGRSTVLFDAFLQVHSGRLVSVDIDAERCAYARSQVTGKTTVVNEDSVSFLHRFSREHPGEIDVLYLDSYDVDWNDPHPSAMHHLKELCAAMPGLRRGSLVVVDDHMDFDGRLGKSKYIVPFMAAIGARKLFEAYQIGWMMP